MSDPANEPVYTGWLQTQMSGDIERAKGLQREARRILGNLLTVTGVNARQAAGEPTGFFKTHRLLGDGSRITAWHNNGMNVIRIDTPPRVEQRAVAAPSVPEVPSYQGEARFAHGGVEFSDRGDLHEPTRLEDEYELHDEEKKEEGYYLWVGVRYTTPNTPYYVINAALIEPRVPNVPGRGILETNQYFGRSFMDLEWSAPSRAALTSKYDGQTTFAQAIETDYTANVTDSLHVIGREPALDMQPGDHCTSIYDATYGSFLMASSNGLLAYATWFWSAGLLVPPTDSERWMPYDPLAGSQDGAQRNIGDRQLGDTYRDMPLRLWDVVFELDPDRSQFPSDPRPEVAEMESVLESDAGMAAGDNKVLPGDYLLLVNSQDSVPQLQSTRAGQAIASPPAIDSGLFRSSNSDYDEYMQQSATTTNLAVDIEVRLNKDPSTVIYHFTSTIETSDDRFVNVSPFGQGTFDACAAEGGKNPMGPNFMQAVIRIDVQAGTAEWGDKQLAFPVYGGGTWAVPGDDRLPLYICVNGNYGVSQPSDSAFAHNAAVACYRVLEEATAGVYGSMLMREWSQADLEAIFADGDRTKVNIFNAHTGDFQVQPIVSSASDYCYDPTCPGSPYQESAYWYYPYKVSLKAQCFNSMGITVTGVEDTFYLESGQQLYDGEPTPPTCGC